MGKSPGKWIKTVLFGKKSSKSNLSRGKDSLKSGDEKEVFGSANAPTADSVVSPSVFSQSAPTDRNGGNSEMEKINSTPRDGEVLIGSGKPDEDTQGTTQSLVPHDPERIKQEQAATRAQAAFRGYLARRAFRALRGIIRLQALIRGHLVRRQAIATLRCMHGIVKFQALVRGRSVRISDIGIGVHAKCKKTLEDAKCSASFGSNTSTSRRERLWANAFISKRFALSTNAMPLRLQYGLDEQNSAWSWLEIWTVSRIWEPLPQPKKVVHSKSQMRPKRSVRRVPAANLDSGSIRSSSEPEKPKRIPRKALSHPVDPVQENPQNELEKVKRNLKKVSNSTTETADRIEVQSDKPKHIPTKASGSPDMGMVGTEVETPRHTTSKSSGSPAPHHPDTGMVELSEKTKKEVDAQMSNNLHGGSPPKSLAADEIVDELHDAQPVVNSPTLESTGKEENGHVTNEELISKEVKTSNEKAGKRRASYPAKQEYPENGSHNSPKLPSYMAATESAKAKLRAQGTPKSGVDGAEQNGLARRHSLPSSTNGKLSSPSPRTQRLVQPSGKGGIKNDKSLLSSRDGNEKVVQAEWRR